MRDVQSDPASHALPIDRVGLKDLRLPLVVRDRVRGNQHTVAQVDIGADLPAHFKGTHMSRFVEALADWSEDLDYKSVQRLLADIRTRLDAQRAFVTFRFPFFLSKSAPATESPGILSYECCLTGELGPEDDGKPRFLLQVDVPVMTVCPCSKAISDEGAHSQRAVVRISARFSGFAWLEELVDIAEAAASSPVYTLLKREDEKHVTEAAFANPTFVEDVVRAAASALQEHTQTTWFRVEVESFESIHNHSAYAMIQSSENMG